MNIVKVTFIVLDAIFSTFIIVFLVGLIVNLPNFGDNPTGHTVGWGVTLFLSWRLYLLTRDLIKGKYDEGLPS